MYYIGVIVVSLCHNLIFHTVNFFLQIIEPISLTVRHFVSVTFKCTWRSMFGSCYAYKLAMPIQWL